MTWNSHPPHPPHHLLNNEGVSTDEKTLPGWTPVYSGKVRDLYVEDGQSLDNAARVLVVALEDAPIDLNRLDKVIGSARLSFASAERLWRFLGIRPGSVTPFALVNDTERKVRVVLQQAMMEHELLNYHPLLNDRTTAIRRDDLLRFIRACGHEPAIVEFGRMEVDKAD